MASLGRQSEKRAAIERDVLRATEELLTSGASFAELNIEKIATRAGISRTAFYFYFRDKRELLMRLTGDVNDQLMTAADGWWTGETEMRDALQRIAEIYGEHGALLRVVVEVSTYDEEVAQYWRSLVGRFAAATRDRIVAEAPEGAETGPAEAMAFALVWMVERTFYEHTVQGSPIPVDQLVDALTTIFTRSVPGA
ncbi:MAG TPA: TetR/AcrR family transcriptional regulator [Solirubrobacteraceae bacterium]|nr:TetR/AcrR family transcriptional regulator [Solirubrobacteraceae bacterium]